MNFNKYDRKKPTTPALKSWNESESVVLLSEFIKQNKAEGIKLYINNGAPCLLFINGTRSIDIIEAATVLLENASDDLMELIGNDLLSLPNKKRVLPSNISPYGRRDLGNSTDLGNEGNCKNAER